MNKLEPQYKPNEAKFIDQRIDALLPEKNFYFYKIFGTKNRQGAELQAQIEKNRREDK